MLRSWDADKGELVCHCDLKCSVREEKELLHRGLVSDWSSSASAAEMASPDWRTGQWTSWDGSRLSRELDILILTILLNIGQTGDREAISVSVLDSIVRAAVLPSVKVIRYSCDQSGNKKIISQSRIELMFYYFGLELPFGHQCSHSQLNSVTSL